MLEVLGVTIMRKAKGSTLTLICFVGRYPIAAMRSGQ